MCGVSPEHQLDFLPGRHAVPGPRRQVVLTGLGRLLIDVVVAGAVPLGKLDELGDDFATDLGAVVGHTTTVGAFEQMF